MTHYPTTTHKFSTKHELRQFLDWVKTYPEIEGIFEQLVELVAKVQQVEDGKPVYVNVETIMNGFADLLITNTERDE